jgi:uncharacterized protein YbjT (DUF2867 family)
MRVLVIGATGQTGQHAVRLLLQRGDHVTAFVRRPQAVAARGSYLSIAVGDARDVSALSQAVDRQEAVLAAFGPRSLKKDDLQEVFMRHLVDGMTTRGVRRLVNLSSWALTPARLDFVTRNIVIPLLAAHVMNDKERSEAILFASGLDYVNIRPGRLFNARARGGVRASRDGAGLKQAITREDLATFMIGQLTDSSWVRQSVYVGY